MPEEIDLPIEELRRVAEIAFQKRVSKLYDPVLRETKDLAEKFANEGIASAGKYQRKVADEVFAKFESIEAIIEEIYVNQLYAQNLPTDEYRGRSKNLGSERRLQQ
jgi:ribosomal protein L4